MTYCQYENYNEIYNKFYTFLFDGINNKIAGKEELVRRFNIINSIQGNIAVKIRLLKPSTLFSDFFDEITENYINIK